MLLLPGADSLAALAIADSIRRAVLEMGMENKGSTEVDVVTVSIGVSCHHSNASDGPEQLVREADQALYAAKRSGRNRVKLFAQWQESDNFNLKDTVTAG